MIPPATPERAAASVTMRAFPDQAVVIVHQDTPQFLAESCAYANLIGGCPGKANCRFESMEVESSHGEKASRKNSGRYGMTTFVPGSTSNFGRVQFSPFSLVARHVWR